MKKIALFGATGFVGSRLLQLLLDEGFVVRLLIRNAVKAEEIKKIQGTEVIHGDIKDFTVVKNCLEETSACIVVTGARSQKKEDMLDIVEGTQNVITAMEDLGIKRLVKLSGTSVRVQGEPFPLMRRFLDWGLKIAMPYPTKSKYLEHDDIIASSLDWIVVRPPVIDKKSVEKKLVAHDYNYLGLKVSRDDLCRFLIEQLLSDKWLHKFPTLGYQ